MPRKKPIARMAKPVFMLGPALNLNLQNTEDIDVLARSFDSVVVAETCRLLAVAKYSHQFGSRVRKPRTASRDQVNVSRQIQLSYFHFLHPPVLDFPAHAHSRHNRNSDPHLNKALDTFDAGHFNGHIQPGAI